MRVIFHHCNSTAAGRLLESLRDLGLTLEVMPEAGLPGGHGRA